VPLLFDRGVFTLSLDFELAWGSRDLMPDIGPLLEASRVLRDGLFQRLLGRMTQLEIVATWATVGHLFLDHAEAGAQGLHPDLIPPRHAWRQAPWLEGVPAGDELSHPEFYARSLVIQLHQAGQEIGCHSFSHPIFGDKGCSRSTAETDIARCVQCAAELDIPLRSFVFPRNSSGFLEVLAKHGFRCWRGEAPVWYHHTRVPRRIRRAAHYADVARAATPPTVMPIRGPHGLWNIPASGSFFPYSGPRRIIPINRRVRRAIQGIDRAVEERRISHLWLHPINLADDPEPMLAGLLRVLEHAAKLRDQGSLEILSMAAVAERAEGMHRA
jgi:peptidoglycan/xylan/chitin deacetylase (PgdA/CDA1 family)